MKTIDVHYSAYVQVDIPDDWDEGEHEYDIIEMAIQHWEKYPDGHWEIVND
jgi:hypothetical protein